MKKKKHSSFLASLIMNYKCGKDFFFFSSNMCFHFKLYKEKETNVLGWGLKDEFGKRNATSMLVEGKLPQNQEKSRTANVSMNSESIWITHC